MSAAAIQCPDHPGLTNDPGHMLNFIDSNCVPYTNGGLDTSIGANSAYMCQLILSSSCLLLILGDPDVAQFSLAVAWLKCIGTGMNTIMLMHHYPANHFLHSLGVLAFMCDSTYIV